MAEVSTVALLERKPTISRDLFSRYWRDVHGVMAARIPGFGTYIQHHVSPLTDVGSVNPEPFEGIALVTYASEADRKGLIKSPITAHMHRDEQNVFRRALLYNLGEGKSRPVITSSDADEPQFFLVVPEGSDPDAVAAKLQTAGAAALDLHDLTGGDPGDWNATDVDDGGSGRRFVAVLMTRWAHEATARQAISTAVATSGGTLAAYRTDARHVMVKDGRPTPLGLRGLDALKTINEACAVNQLDHAVEDVIFGHIK